jgi:hypothetical protein
MPPQGRYSNLHSGSRGGAARRQNSPETMTVNRLTTPSPKTMRGHMGLAEVRSVKLLGVDELPALRSYAVYPASVTANVRC